MPLDINKESEKSPAMLQAATGLLKALIMRYKFWHTLELPGEAS